MHPSGTQGAIGDTEVIKQGSSPASLPEASGLGGQAGSTVLNIGQGPHDYLLCERPLCYRNFTQQRGPLVAAVMKVVSCKLKP